MAASNARRYSRKTCFPSITISIGDVVLLSFIFKVEAAFRNLWVGGSFADYTDYTAHRGCIKNPSICIGEKGR